MAELSDSGWDALRRDLSDRVAAFAPDWTDYTESDPGITLVELFGFFAESLVYRADLSPHARARLREILERLERAGEPACDDATLTRNRFFTGKLLSAEDLDLEQSYLLTKHRRHNRLLHGIGIVSGLGVSLEPRSPGDDPVLVISPGIAISPEGEELVLCEQATLDGCQGGSVCYVTLALAERPVDPTPGGEASRIEESAAVAVLENIPRGHLAIARLTRDDGGWRLDAGFEPARVR